MKWLSFALLAACRLVEFSINGAGADLDGGANNTVNGVCRDNDLLNAELRMKELIASLVEDDTPYAVEQLRLDLDPDKLEVRLQFDLYDLDTSKIPDDPCVAEHPTPYGRYELAGVRFSYEYDDRGETRSDSFTVRCADTVIDFADGPSIAPAINACLDEIEQTFEADAIEALNRHPRVIHVRASVKECDPDACFSIGFKLRVMVMKSTAHMCE